jgi:hypothetical protein
MLCIKNTTTAGSWMAQDTSTYAAGTNTQVSGDHNKQFFKLEEHNADFESAAHAVIETTATGFKIHAQTVMNDFSKSGDKFIYFAFA